MNRSVIRIIFPFRLLICLLLTLGWVGPSQAELQFEVSSFVIEGDNPLGSSKSRAILEPFTGKHTGIERLRAAASALETALNKKGYNFHRVTLPPQVLQSGNVTLEIRRLLVGQVTTSGNKYFSEANLLRSLPQLAEGETPNTRTLSRALAVANFNGAKRTRLTFGRGTAEDTLDARIDVRERQPQELFAWANNSGTELSTRSRIGAGYQHHNLFDRDHKLTTTYTTSAEEPDKVSQYGVNYEIPLYRLTSTLALFHANSDIDSGRVAEAFDVSGKGRTNGVRYSQILNKLGEFRQRMYVDVFDKLFDNRIDFFANDVGVDVRSRPLSVSWQLEWDKPASNGRFNLSMASNLGGGSFNNDQAYAASRPGASADWQAMRINATQTINLPRSWKFSTDIQGQWTDEPMISGEQLGLGGSYGPRGFEEREAGVDRGANIKLQLWAPPTSGNLQFGGFLDYGLGRNLQLAEGQTDNIDLTSAGLSAKWSWRNRLVTAIDLGHVLDGFEPDSGLTESGDSRLHISMLYRFNRD